jgi:hypothetical protein
MKKRVVKKADEKDKNKLVTFNIILGISIPIFIFILMMVIMGFESPVYYNNNQISSLVYILELYPVIAAATLIASLILMKFKKYKIAKFIFIFPILNILAFIILLISVLSSL